MCWRGVEVCVGERWRGVDVCVEEGWRCVPGGVEVCVIYLLFCAESEFEGIFDPLQQFVGELTHVLLSTG